MSKVKYVHMKEYIPSLEDVDFIGKIYSICVDGVELINLDYQHNIDDIEYIPLNEV